MNPAILTGNFEALGNILGAVSIAMGLALFLGGFFKLKKYGEMRTMMSQQLTLASPFMYILSGVILLLLPTMINTGLNAFWGSYTPLNYTVSGTNGWDQYIPAIIDFVRVIGVGSFIRGVVQLSRAGNPNGQQGMVGKGLIHIVAGIFLIHIIGTVTLLQSLFGLD